jgi:hypothetical protein
MDESHDAQPAEEASSAAAAADEQQEEGQGIEPRRGSADLDRQFIERAYEEAGRQASLLGPPQGRPAAEYGGRQIQAAFKKKGIATSTETEERFGAEQGCCGCGTADAAGDTNTDEDGDPFYRIRFFGGATCDDSGERLDNWWSFHRPAGSKASPEDIRDLEQEPLPTNHNLFLRRIYRWQCEEQKVKPNSGVLRALAMDEECALKKREFSARHLLLGAGLAALLPLLAHFPAARILRLDLSAAGLRTPVLRRALPTIRDYVPSLAMFDVAENPLGTDAFLPLLGWLVSLQTVLYINVDGTNMDRLQRSILYVEACMHRRADPPRSKRFLEEAPQSWWSRAGEMTQISDRYENESVVYHLSEANHHISLMQQHDDAHPADNPAAQLDSPGGNYPEFARPDGAYWRLFDRASVRRESPRRGGGEGSRSWIEHLHREYLEMVAKARQHSLDGARRVPSAGYESSWSHSGGERATDVTLRLDYRTVMGEAAYDWDADGYKEGLHKMYADELQMPASQISVKVAQPNYGENGEVTTVESVTAVSSPDESLSVVALESALNRIGRKTRVFYGDLQLCSVNKIEDDEHFAEGHDEPAHDEAAALSPRSQTGHDEPAHDEAAALSPRNLVSPDVQTA